MKGYSQVQIKVVNILLNEDNGSVKITLPDADAKIIKCDINDTIYASGTSQKVYKVNDTIFTC
jgi:hypothetical protein